MTIIIISLLLLVSLPPLLTLIVNNKEASPHSRPYMVSLQLDGEHICGGFIISDQFVLTAAHCQNNEEKLTVVVGAHDLRNKEEGSEHIRVKSYNKHPDFHRKTLKNDIMLLKLEKEVKISKNVHLTLNKNQDIKADTLCTIAGWGRQFTNGPYSDRLMEAEVKIMENKLCLNKWTTNNENINVKYSLSKMMCVSGKGGSCDGDSGGPLVCGDTVVGVTSFGNPHLCNSHLLPNVYTKIAAYYNWINKTIEKENK